jgi:hypothetical protein
MDANIERVIEVVQVPLELESVLKLRPSTVKASQRVCLFPYVGQALTKDAPDHDAPSPTINRRLNNGGD